MAIIKVKTGGITADAITDALIADDVVGTEHLTANEVDTTALGADAVTGAQLADDAVNSEHYTDGSVDTAHIADAQITTAKLSTAVLTGATDIGAAIADADLFLVDDGAGGTLRKTAASRIKTYVGSAGMTLLTSGDITSTTSSFTIDSTYVNDTYEHYQLWLRGKGAGDGVQMQMRYRNDADNANVTSNYSWRVGGVADNGNGTNSTSGDLIRLTYAHSGNAANEGFNMVLDFMSPRSNLVPTACMWSLTNANTSDDFKAMHGAARRNDGTEKHSGFIIFFGNGGDFANGTNYEFYGLKKIMARYKMINGVRSECTAAEVAELDAMKAAWDSKAFDRAIAELRFKRNQLLAETDYMANSDVTMSDDMKTYRQALRDLPSGLDTVEKVNAKEFPTKPGA